MHDVRERESERNRTTTSKKAHHIQRQTSDDDGEFTQTNKKNILGVSQKLFKT